MPRKYRLFFINQIPSSTREPLDEGKNVSKDNAEEVEYNVLTEPKIRRLINLTQYAKQPPKMDTDSERRTQEVKSNIMQAYKQYQPNKRNITRKEKSALRTLREPDDVIIKRSDKSKSLVVLGRDTYIRKAEAILSDTDSLSLQR